MTNLWLRGLPSGKDVDPHAWGLRLESGENTPVDFQNLCVVLYFYLCGDGKRRE